MFQITQCPDRSAVSPSTTQPDYAATAPVDVLNRMEVLKLIDRLVPVGTEWGWSEETSIAVPTNWLRCSGAQVSQTTYPVLFALIGTTYGPATGGNFTLPTFSNMIIRAAYTYN